VQFCISLEAYADSDHDLEFFGGLDVVSLRFDSVEELAAWVKRHLGDDGPGGLIDVGRVLREGREVATRLRQKDREAESARSAGQKRRVRQPRSGQAGDPDLPPGSKP
jgi:hypothetical protein